MPFQSVAELRASPIFQRMATLRNMSTAKLQRFIAAFNTVHARATRNGATTDEAEVSAIRIALAAAKKAEAIAARPLEDTVHVYALMATDMFSVDDGVDTGYVFPNTQTMNAVMAGNPFNLNHDHTDQMGVIRQVMATKDIPAELKGRIDPDIRVAALVSFFKDVPPEDRHVTASAEWVEMELSSGHKMAVPFTFAVTSVSPANGKELGIGKVATLEHGLGSWDEKAALVLTQEDASENSYEHRQALMGIGMHMPEQLSPEELQEKVAGLESEKTKVETSLSEAQEKLASMEKDFNAFKENIAKAIGLETPPEEADNDAIASQVQSKVATLEDKVNGLVEKAATIQANAWADDQFRSRIMDDEMKTTLASLYLKDQDTAEKIASGLPERELDPQDPKTITAAMQVDDKTAKELDAHIATALNIPEAS